MAEVEEDAGVDRGLPLAETGSAMSVEEDTLSPR
jgi:hypothetical protein